MTKRIINLLAIALLFAFAYPANAGLYRWIDKDGKVHYSDKVPQKFSQNGHVVLNTNGTKKKVIISALKRKQIKETKEQKVKQLKKEAQLKKQKELEEMRDIQLLNMFTTPNELITVYNAKVEMTDESINLLKARHKSQSIKLEKLENQHERTKNPHSKELLAKKIDNLLDNLRVYQQAITENYVEKEKLKKEFDTNFSRFNELLQRQKQAKK